MALDQAYFDSIRFETVRKKYYNARKVEDVLADIRRQALALEAENELLRAELSRLRDRKEEVAETLLSAKSVARQILLEAQAQADEIVAAAIERGSEQSAKARQAESARLGEACYGRVREQLLRCLDELNADLQDYLRSLDADAGTAEDPLADLDEKVGAIARELMAMDSGDSILAESIKL